MTAVGGPAAGSVADGRRVVRVVLRKEDIPAGGLAFAAAAVIDVLRATSTIATALAHGAAAVHPCASREEAEGRAAALRAAGVPCLLAGEAGAVRIPGYDLGNSPREFTPERVAGREVVLLTTNGTRALRAVAETGSVVAASLLNARAAAAMMLDLARRGDGDLLLVCAGTAGSFSLDDFLCAGCLADALEQGGRADAAGRATGREEPDGAVVLDDLARAARDAFRQNRARLGEALGSCRHAAVLREAGLGEDVGYCARLDALDVVPVLVGGRLVAARLDHRIADEREG